MTAPATTGECRNTNCRHDFKKLFSHQIYCDVPCAFWSRVTCGTWPQSPTDCWEWTGSKSSSGYGEFRYNGVLIRTHRFSYELHYGPLGDGLWALHHCDNRQCVNPNHLYAGTVQDNSRDVWVRETALKKLTHKQAKEIDRRLVCGENYRRIAKDYPITDAVIYHRRCRLVKLGQVPPLVPNIIKHRSRHNIKASAL